MADTVITPTTGSDTAFDSQPIQTEEDYHNVLEQMMKLLRINPDVGTPEDKRLVDLAAKVIEWERRKPEYTQFEFNGDMSTLL